jgi:hypothetical protein
MIPHDAIKTSIDGVKYIAYRDREEARDHASFQCLELPRGVTVHEEPAKDADGNTWWIVPDDGSTVRAVRTKKNPRFIFKSDLRVKRHARVANRLAKRRAVRHVDRQKKTDRITRRSNPSADEKLAWIKSQLESGRDVYLTTATRSTRYTPKHLTRINDLLRVKGGTFQMRERKSWVSADYVKISAR